MNVNMILSKKIDTAVELFFGKIFRHKKVRHFNAGGALSMISNSGLDHCLAQKCRGGFHIRPEQADMESAPTQYVVERMIRSQILITLKSWCYL